MPLSEVPLAQLLDLLAGSLGRGSAPRGERFFRWKHSENPFGPSAGLVALDSDDRPVAARIFLRWRWAAGGTVHRAVRAVDTATHPAWRRRGLFRRLTLELAESLKEEGVAFVFNTPNRRSRAGYLSMGWNDAGRAPLLVRPRVASLPRLAFSRLFPGAARSDGDRPLPRPAPLVPMEELLADPASRAFLAAWSRGESRLHTPRDPEYLRWRYARAPGPAEDGGLGYGGLSEIDGDGSGALVVARARRRHGSREIALAEVLIGPGAASRRTAARLIDTIVEESDADHLTAVASAGTAERRVLLRRGFLPLSFAGPRLTVRPLAGFETASGTETPRATVKLELPEESVASFRLGLGDLELF